MRQLMWTGERAMPENFKSKEEYIIYLECLFMYDFVKNKIPKNSIVLDVGCGEGYGVNLLSKNVTKIIGLDIDKNIIAHASKKYGKNCIYKLYDGKKIPYKANTFDAVIFLQVIEHINDDKNHIAEIYRVLKNNGIFILTTPNGARLKPGQKPWNRFHIREYLSNELESLLKSQFSNVKVWGVIGNKEIQKIEKERTKQALKIIAFDPLNLRTSKLIFEPLKILFVEILKKIVRNPLSKLDRDFINRHSIKDFHVMKTNIRESLFLLGICKK